MKLSIDNMTIVDQGDRENFLETSAETTQADDGLFGSAYRKKEERKISLSGKVFTDDVSLENKEYLHAVDGVQINIDGKFN